VKRDMELIRKLVLALEDALTGYAPDDLKIQGYTPEQVGYHAYLLIDAGLSTGNDVSHMGSSSPEAMLTSLTWAGTSLRRLRETRLDGRRRWVLFKGKEARGPCLCRRSF
jgi:hypothetical protein